MNPTFDFAGQRTAIARTVMAIGIEVAPVVIS